MKFKITTLCENTVPISRGLVGEHGLSFFIECEKANILFDTGQGIGIVQNAEKLGKDLSSLDYVVLSHGHYDHTGGLHHVLEKKPGVKIIAHPDIFQKKTGVLPGKDSIKIGIPFEKSYIQDRGSLVITKAPYSIMDHVITTGQIPMTTPYESVDSGLFIETSSGIKHDEVLDDLSLILKSDAGPVIVAGCSHRGIVNILKHARLLTGSEKFHALLGGLHLARASENQLENTIGALEKLSIEKVVPSHCTGFEASAKMFNRLGEKVIFNKVGEVFEF